MGEGSVVQGSLSLVVLGTEDYFAAEEGFHDDVLSVATGNVERSASVTVDRIRLWRARE